MRLGHMPPQHQTVRGQPLQPELSGHLRKLFGKKGRDLAFVHHRPHLSPRSASA
jgi:hypothetical protein